MSTAVCLSVCLSVHVSLQIFITSLFSKWFQQTLYAMTSHVENKPWKIFAWPLENKQKSFIKKKILVWCLYQHYYTNIVGLQCVCANINISYNFHWIFKVNTFWDFPNLGAYRKIDTGPILWSTKTE